MDKKPTKQVLIRLPEEIKELLQQKASENHRTLNGEILARLEETLKSEEEKKSGNRT